MAQVCGGADSTPDVLGSAETVQDWLVPRMYMGVGGDAQKG
jgi:hypothetical protein